MVYDLYRRDAIDNSSGSKNVCNSNGITVTGRRYLRRAWTPPLPPTAAADTTVDTTAAMSLAGITTAADTNSATSPALPVGPPCRPGVPPGPAARQPGRCRPVLLRSAAPHLRARGTASAESQCRACAPALCATSAAGRATSRQSTHAVILERTRE